MKRGGDSSLLRQFATGRKGVMLLFRRRAALFIVRTDLDLSYMEKWEGAGVALLLNRVTVPATHFQIQTARIEYKPSAPHWAREVLLFIGEDAGSLAASVLL